MKWLFSMLLLAITVNSVSQDFDKILIKKQVSCSDISENSSLFLVHYIQENKFDSARQLLAYWESKCGLTEPIFRIKTLLSIYGCDYDDSSNINGVLKFIFNYKSRMEVIRNHYLFYFYDGYGTDFGYVPPGQEFDNFTLEFADSLKGIYQPETIQYLLCDFYSGNDDSIFQKLQSKNYSNSSLSKEYNQEVSKYKNKAELHCSGIIGIWIPTGNLTQIGLHPEIGLQLGAKHRKMNYDLTATFKFINSPNDYLARRKKSTDSLELTNHFLGGYFGIDVGRDIFYTKGHEFQIIGGIGIDGFDALKQDKTRNLESETVWTYNFNIGLSYRYYISNSLYIGVRAKYNIVDYSLNKVIDFTGNPITIQLVIGNVNSTYRNMNLKSLEYKQRRD